MAYAKAAYQSEIERLGVLTYLLLSRPSDAPEKILLDALHETEIFRKSQKTKVKQGKNQDSELGASLDEKTGEGSSWWSWFCNRWSRGRDNTNATPATTQRQPSFKELLSHKFSNWKLPSLSDYSIQWMTDGASSLLSIRKLESNGELHAPAASTALLKSWSHNQNKNNEVWLQEASEWTSTCRSTLFRILLESRQGSSSEVFDETEFSELKESWVSGMPSKHLGGNQDRLKKASRYSQSITRTPESIAQDWAKILNLVDNLPGRRTGEGEALRLRDAAIVSWTRRLNILGLPLALLQILLANALHTFAKPYWPDFKRDVIQISLKLLEIMDQRVWIPLKGIYDEIMNRSKGLMSGFGLQLEERSLDHMLRDLGYGDGTAASRAAALERAATQYEKDLNQGLYMNVASGRLVRLLLVQVQQLKVGLLQALDTIDVLIKVREGSRLFDRHRHSIGKC